MDLLLPDGFPRRGGGQICPCDHKDIFVIRQILLIFWVGLFSNLNFSHLTLHNMMAVNSAVKRSSVQRKAVQCSTMQCSAVQCRAVQCCIVESDAIINDEKQSQSSHLYIQVPTPTSLLAFHSSHTCLYILVNNYILYLSMSTTQRKG